MVHGTKEGRDREAEQVGAGFYWCTINTSLFFFFFFQLLLQGSVVCGDKMKIFVAGQEYSSGILTFHQGYFPEQNQSITGKK